MHPLRPRAAIDLTQGRHALFMSHGRYALQPQGPSRAEAAISDVIRQPDSAGSDGSGSSGGAGDLGVGVDEARFHPGGPSALEADPEVGDAELVPGRDLRAVDEELPI